jgi:hypothetical protein
MKFLLVPLLALFPLLAIGQTKVPVTFSGGHDTVGVDRGRPVILIASALDVPPGVFREVFSHVKPAPAGEQPDPVQVVKNKQALLDGLGPYGVTDDRLNTVSNYYRYRRSAGEMWRNTPAEAYVMVTNGRVTSITITNAGAGYSSSPAISLPGLPDVHLSATLSYGTDLEKNGSIKEIKVVPQI